MKKTLATLNKTNTASLFEKSTNKNKSKTEQVELEQRQPLDFDSKEQVPACSAGTQPVSLSTSDIDDPAIISQRQSSVTFTNHTHQMGLHCPVTTSGTTLDDPAVIATGHCSNSSVQVNKQYSPQVNSEAFEKLFFMMKNSAAETFSGLNGSQPPPLPKECADKMPISQTRELPGEFAI